MNRKVSIIKVSLLLFALFTALAGCLPAPYFQKEEPIPQNAWTYSYKPTFTFDITDTAVIYQTFLLIRHTQAYPYSNLWMWVNIKMPGDSVMKKERVNIMLAETNGKWLGRGMGEIWEQRLPVRFADSSINFSKKGTYQISLEQDMRINPLPEVLHVGLRVEKTGLVAR